MKSLGILALAAASFMPVAAFAQTVTPPPEEDTPSTTLRTPAPKATPTPVATPTPAPGVTWQQPAASTPRAASPIARPAPPAPVAVAPTPPTPPARVVVVPAPTAQAAPPPPPVRVEVRRAPSAATTVAPPVVVHRAPPGDVVEVRDREMIHEGPAPHRERVVVRHRAMDHGGPHHAGPGPMMEHASSPEAWGEVVEETVTVDADGREHRSVVRRPVAPHELAEGGILAPYVRMRRAHSLPVHGIEPRVHAYGGYGPHRPMWGSRWGRKWDEGHRGGRRGGIPEYVGSGNYRPGDEDYARFRSHHGYPGYGYFQAPPQPGPVVVETIVTTTGTVVENPR